jgi:hypothetical protein
MSDAKLELEALWWALFQEPPVIDADPRMLAAVITHCLPAPPPYEFGRQPPEETPSP